MSGVIAGLIGSVKAAATVTNIVNNGSATSSSDLANWYGTSRDTNVYKTSPASWLNGLDGDDNPIVEFYNTNLLTVGTSYSLSFWVKPAGAMTLNIVFYCGTNFGTNTVTPTIGIWNYYKIENIQCLVNKTIDVMLVGSNNFNIDDMWVVSGATAV
jgi:hypothetical protein